MAEWNPHRDRARTESSTPCWTTHTQTHTHTHTHTHTNTHTHTHTHRCSCLQISAPPQCDCSAWRVELPAPGTTAEWACSLFATVIALFPQFQHVKGDIMHMGFTLTDQQHLECLYSGGPQGSLFTDRDKHSSALLGFQKFLSVIITFSIFSSLVLP